jgi:hypothetical protein
LVLPVLLLAACGGGTTIVDPPPPPADNFVFTFRPDAEDQASAQALGWGTVIPDADITVTPKDAALGGPQTHRTTAAGTVTIAKLTAADYVVEAKRWLSDIERGRLTGGDDAVGFVAKAYVRVAAGGGQSTVAVPASRRRALVISEFFNNRLNLIPDAYAHNAFVELYNSSDTTIYVDGMILARALAPSANYPNFPCSLYAPYSGDPGGVWARFMVKFPGTGQEYPVPAGATVVIATDAIDHSAIVSEGFDLRSAQFEMMGPSDVDNPAVPNMIDITEGGYTGLGHGQDWAESGTFVTVLSRAVATNTLQRAPPTIAPFLRLPGELILDALSSHGTYQEAYPNCPSLVHANFDRAMNMLFYGTEFTLSAQRRRAPMLLGGRKVLQHSRSSDADFLSAVRSPGLLP